ncbi:MAG: HNH endonuclease [Candidatus Dormibacteria bacterium]
MDTALRLPLTLIPRSCWEINVRTALPERWDEIRREVYRRAGHRCEACGSAGGNRPLHAHEYWGYEGNRQVLTHIACLCDVCHAATHLGRTRSFSGSDRAAHEALAHLARVNSWSIPEAAAYAQQELARTAELSKHRYALDLSLLEREFGIEVPAAGASRGGAGWLRQLLGVGR